MSFEQLVDDTRPAEAIRLIDESDITIADIAALVGYSDSPHFMNAFGRWTEMTPITFGNIALKQ